jgi:hypothetical protein
MKHCLWVAIVLAMIALNINFRFVGAILIKINMKLQNYEAKILAAIEAWLLCMNINDIDLIP